MELFLSHAKSQGGLIGDQVQGVGLFGGQVVGSGNRPPTGRGHDFAEFCRVDLCGSVPVVHDGWPHAADGQQSDCILVQP